MWRYHGASSAGGGGRRRRGVRRGTCGRRAAAAEISRQIYFFMFPPLLGAISLRTEKFELFRFKFEFIRSCAVRVQTYSN